VKLEAAYADRAREAKTLDDAGHKTMSTAMWMYALEVRLKALICKHLALDHLPTACKTHDLAGLIIFTGLSPELDLAGNELIRKSWDRLADFSKKRLNDLRYLPDHDLADGERDDLLLSLTDAQEGVLPWLSKPR